MIRSLSRLTALAIAVAVAAASSALVVPLTVGPSAAASESARIIRSPEFIRDVNEAIERGVKSLRSLQLRTGEWPVWGGYGPATTALAYHTMRVCGVPADDPALIRGYEALRRGWLDSSTYERETYTTALVMMAVAEHGKPLPKPDGEKTTALTDPDRDWMREMVAILEKRQANDGTWGYAASGNRNSRQDHSNTQYALLGLKAAARCGVPVKASTWRIALQHLISAQADTGPLAFAGVDEMPKKSTTSSPPLKDRARGWGYTTEGLAYGSMTAGGIASVVICRSELLGTAGMVAGLDQKAERSIRDGLAWMGVNFTVLTNPGPPSTMAGPGWHYYYLYAVERAGVLAGVEVMGDRDWYGEGARFLLEAQGKDGFWAQNEGFSGVRGIGARRPEDVTIHTSFALLFLRKGTLPVRRGALTQGAAADDIRFDGADQLSAKDFDDLIDLVVQRWRRSDDDQVRLRLTDRTATVGPRIVTPLLVRMSSDDEEERTAAFTFLSRATGLDFSYDPTAELSKREDAILSWQGWWLTNGKTLTYDKATRRLK